MTVVRPPARVVVHEAGFFAAFLAMAALSAAQLIYASQGAPDWQGYEALYEGSADWLTPNELAPLFMAFLGGARWVFGPEGYGLFRLALFGLFAGFACWLAYIMPMQRRLGGLSAFMTGTAVITAMLLKSIVQIREGLAFVVLLIGIVALLRHNSLRFAGSGAAAAVAPFIHAGTVPLSGVWLIATALTWMPLKILKSHWLHRSIGLSAFALGSCLALAVIANGETVAAYVTRIGIETSATSQGGAVKLLYWGALGVAVSIIGKQAKKSDGKLDIAISIALCMGLLPFTYGFCVILVVTKFAVPAVTSMGIRILFTGFDLALMIICLRGRLNWVTAGVTVFMLIDELRLLATA